MEYSLIIPIYNEANTITSLINEICDLDEINEIIIIDDGSNDGTSKLLSKIKNIKLIINDKNTGKSTSIVKALSKTKGKYVVLFDGDLEIKPNEINKLLTIHKKNKNILVKGKRVSLSPDISMFNLGNKILNYFFNILYNSSFNDVFCCLIIIEKKLLNSFKISSKKFGIETEIMANIATKNLTIKEENVDYNRRNSSGGKKLKIFDVIEIIKIMINNRL
jgi:glycosyltransferase involved in cell wall biosynthesis